MGSMVSSNVSRSGRSLLYAFYIVASLFFYVFWTLSIKFGGVDKYPVSSIDLSTSLISLAALVIYKRRNEGKSDAQRPNFALDWFLSLVSLESFTAAIIILFTATDTGNSFFLLGFYPGILAAVFFERLHSSPLFKRRGIRVRSKRKFIHVPLGSSSEFSMGLAGDFENMSKSNLIDENVRNLIQGTIRGEITKEEFQNRLAQLDPLKQDIVKRSVKKLEYILHFKKK